MSILNQPVETEEAHNLATKSLRELMFENASAGMGMLTADGIWIDANQSLCDLFGLSREQILERSLFTLIHAADAAEMLCAWKRFESGEIGSFQNECRCAPRSEREIWGQFTVTRLQSSSPAEVFAVQVKDITRRKEAEDARHHSEALFRSIGENAGDLIFVVNFPALEILYASPTFESVLGYSASQLTGGKSIELLHPDDHTSVGEAIKAMLEHRNDASIILVRFRDADGAFHWVEAHGCAVRNKDGQVERFVIIGRLADERIETERRLAASERRLQLILDSTAEGIFGLDLNGNCTFCNAACLKMLGYSSSDAMLGQNVHRLIHHSDSNGAAFETDNRLTSTLVHGRSVHVEDHILWRSDGTHFAAELWAYPIVNGVELVGCVVTFVDITARKAADAALRNSHRDAEQFIDSVPSILIGLDASGCIERWNLAAAQTFGLEESAVKGKHFSSCGIHWLQDVNSVVKSGAESDQAPLDSLRFDRNGNPRIFGFTLRRTKSYEDNRLQLLIIGADITERQRAAEDLQWKTAFLEAQTNSTDDGVLVVGPDGRKILQNRRMLELFQVPQSIADNSVDEVLLQHVLTQVKRPDAFLERVRFLYAHHDQISREEIELIDGRVLDRYTSPVLGSQGEHYGRIWTFRDISERKKTQDLLQQLSQAVEQSPVSIVITDLDGRITYVNRKFTEASGYTAQEAVGKNQRFLKTGRTSPADYKHLWDSITSGREWRGVFHNLRKNGESYCEKTVIQPILGLDGAISHFLGIKEDISEKLALEAQLRQSQKLEAIGQLAAGIAHEINTPMQYIGDNTRFLESTWTSLQPVFSQLLTSGTAQSGKSPADVMKNLEEMCENADLEYLTTEVPNALQQSLDGIQRVTKIVQAMKEFSHPGSEKKVPADINKAIQTTVTVARNEWKYVSNLITSLDEQLGLVPCLIGEFNQVILNLIINAAHAIADVVGDGTGSKGQITVQTAKKGDEAEISIEDTGAGIPEEIRARIFEPFFTTKAPGKGTGQGLAIAHNTIVEKHGGKLWFDSEIGKGTKFYIRLPLH